MNLHAPVGATKRRKTLGRGTGTGRGTTSGRGTKGQKARAGYSQQVGFEGGQMPLARRVPKRGFNNRRFEHGFQIVNIGDLERFNNDDKVDYGALLERGVVDKKSKFVKLLGKGKLTKKLHVYVNRASQKAVQEVEKVGGTVEII